MVVLQLVLIKFTKLFEVKKYRFFTTYLPYFCFLIISLSVIEGSELNVSNHIEKQNRFYLNTTFLPSNLVISFFDNWVIIEN